MSTRSRIVLPLLFAVASATVVPIAAGGQSTSLLAAGARVRVQETPSAAWRQGRFVAADSASVVLGRRERISNARGRLVTITLHDTIPVGSMRVIEVSRGRSGAGRRATLGFVLGAVAGAGATAVMAAAAGGSGDGYDALGIVVIGGPILTVTLGTTGAIIGWKSAPERWERVEPPLRVAGARP